MKELIIIRHARAEHYFNGMTGGWTKSQLTDLGRRQARVTGPRLAKLVENRKWNFYTSDLDRAVETAEIIGEAVGKKAVPTPELRELNNGEAANILQKDAAKIANPVTHPILDWIHYPGGESWRMMTDRIVPFMERIDNDDCDLNVVITHGGAAIPIVRWWLEDKYSNISVELTPCSITHLRVNKWDERTIVKVNDAGHLSFAP